MKTPLENPSGHLSYSAELGWSLIKDGMPLCAHNANRQEVENIADLFKLELPSVFWNGEIGKFV